MLKLIGAIIEIILLILSNKFEKDNVKKKEKEGLSKEISDAVKSGDISRINGAIQQLRK